MTTSVARPYCASAFVSALRARDINGRTRPANVETAMMNGILSIRMPFFVVRLPVRRKAPRIAASGNRLFPSWRSKACSAPATRRAGGGAVSATSGILIALSCAPSGLAHLMEDPAASTTKRESALSPAGELNATHRRAHGGTERRTPGIRRLNAGGRCRQARCRISQPRSPIHRVRAAGQLVDRGRPPGPWSGVEDAGLSREARPDGPLPCAPARPPPTASTTEEILWPLRRALAQAAAGQ